MDTHKLKALVDKDIEEGEEAGVNGTPAFFINGRMISGAQPFEVFKKIIDEELSAKETLIQISRKSLRPVTTDADDRERSSHEADERDDHVIAALARVIGFRNADIKYPPANPPRCAKLSMPGHQQAEDQRLHHDRHRHLLRHAAALRP